MEMGDKEWKPTKWYKKPCFLCSAAVPLVLLLLVTVVVIVLKHTSIAHTYLLTTIWRDFSINK